MNSKDKVYLGDGVYVETEEFALRLTTSNGVYDTNIIFLEPEVLEALLRYVHKSQQKPKPLDDGFQSDELRALKAAVMGDRFEALVMGRALRRIDTLLSLNDND